MNHDTIDNAEDMAILLMTEAKPSRGVRRSLAWLLCAISGGGIVTWLASSEMFVPALQVGAYAMGSVAALYMAATRRGPLHWLTWASIQAQAVCLGIREEIAAAVRSGVAEHGERVRRIKARHE